MKRVQVQYCLDILASIGQFINFLPGRAAERVGVQENELAVLAPDQRRLGADIDNARNLERAANVPEIVRDPEYLDGVPLLVFGYWASILQSACHSAVLQWWRWSHYTHHIAAYQVCH